MYAFSKVPDINFVSRKLRTFLCRFAYETNFIQVHFESIKITN